MILSDGPVRVEKARGAQSTARFLKRLFDEVVGYAVLLERLNQA